MRFRVLIGIFVVLALSISMIELSCALNGEEFYGYVDKAYSGTIKAKIHSTGTVVSQTTLEEVFDSDKFLGQYGFTDNFIVWSCGAGIISDADTLDCADENEQIDFYINNQFVGSRIFELNRETRMDISYSIIPYARIDAVNVAYVGQDVTITSQIKDGVRPYYISVFDCSGTIESISTGIYGTMENSATLTDAPAMVCRYDKEGDYLITLKGSDSRNNYFYISKPIKIIAAENTQNRECIPNWDCTDFSYCTPAQTKIRKCLDMNQCNNDSDSIKPLEKISCIYNLECSPNWKCTDWAECIDGKKTRICNDVNNCNKEKPAEEKECGANAVIIAESPEIVAREQVSPLTWIMAILLILVGSTAAYHNTKKAIARGRKI